MASLVVQCSFKKISKNSKLLYKQTLSSINQICEFKRNVVKHKKLCNIFTIYKQGKKPQLLLTQNQPILFFFFFFFFKFENSGKNYLETFNSSVLVDCFNKVNSEKIIKEAISCQYVKNKYFSHITDKSVPLRRNSLKLCLSCPCLYYCFCYYCYL